jgi:hypothetical protein
VTTTATDRPVADLPEVRLGIAVAAAFVSATALHVTHVQLWAGVTTMLLVVTVGAAALPVRFGLCLGAAGWGLLTGFLVNSGGQLTFDGPDLQRLGLLVVAGALVSAGFAVGRGSRAYTARSSRSPRDREGVMA